MLQLLQRMRIKPEEKKILGLSALFAMLIGSAETFVQVIPLAVFLATYDSALLPYVYIGMGLTLYFFGNIFKSSQKHVSFFNFLLSPLVIIFFTSIAFLALLLFTNYHWFPMVFLIWGGIAYSFLGIVGPTMGVRIFTLQEGKRFFGIIGGFLALGSIITGFLIPGLLKVIPPRIIFLLAPITILSAIWVLFLIKKHGKDRFAESKSSELESSEPITINNLTNKLYVLCIFILSTVSTFNYFCLDLLFNAEVKAHFVNEITMTYFLGIFSAVSSTFVLIGGFFIFGFLLEKAGVIITLFITPLIVGTFVVFTLLVNLIPSRVEIAFGLFLCLILLERMLRVSINVGAVAILYQSLKPREKLWTQLQYKSIIQPLTASVVGLVLLLISSQFGIHIADVLPLVLWMYAFGLLALFFIKNNYIKMLITTLTKQAIVKPEIEKIDKDTLEILKKHLSSPFPNEVLYVLQMIEEIEPDHLAATLLETLESPSDDIRRYSLNKIEQYRILSAKEKVKAICLKEKNPEVLGYALRAFGAIADLEQLLLFHEYIHSSNRDIASDSLIASILYGSERLKEEARALLEQKAKSTNPNDRAVPAIVLRYVDIPNKVSLLSQLLSDPILEIRRLSCKAAINDEKLYPLLIENLTNPHLQGAAFTSLVHLARSDYIVEHFAKFSSSKQVLLIRLLGYIKNDLTFLQTFLTNPNRRLQAEAIRSLKNQSFRATNSNLIKSILNSEKNNIIILRNLLGAFQSEKTAPIHDLLCREIELIQDNCFFLLTFIYPDRPILSAVAGLRSGDHTATSLATEILVQLIEDDRLLRELTFLPYSDSSSPTHMEESLRKILQYPPLCPGIHSAAIYAIGENNLKSLSELVRNFKDELDPYLEEIRPWTLKTLGT